MARDTKIWHPNFIEYMKTIVNHPNYKGLPIKLKEDGSYSWIAGAKSEIGYARIEWAKRKAKELGISDGPGVYAKVMLAIHPLKRKPCQICGEYMSLYYHYPSANFVKLINKTFKTNFSMNKHISDIYEIICCSLGSDIKIKSFLIEKGDLNLTTKATKEEIIDAIEKKCRLEGKKLLSPGAMSNFPDRYDGFHTYNRCCRSTEDKGRSAENLKSYTKDRRAYEYWSDGNIHAADQFMGSSFFKGISADHIGPISLGFVHDPRYLQPMSGSDNSSKRDRLQVEDIEKIIEVEKRTKVYPISWYSKDIWEFIKANYKKNKTLVPTIYRDALKQNMTDFMYILGIIKRPPRREIGEAFLEECFLKANYSYFDYSYSFNAKGEIISQEKRHFTDRNKDELDRYRRIAFDSIDDYNLKDNRHYDPDLTSSEIDKLKKLISSMSAEGNFPECKKQLISLISDIQGRLVASLNAKSH